MPYVAIHVIAYVMYCICHTCHIFCICHTLYVSYIAYALYCICHLSHMPYNAYVVQHCSLYIWPAEHFCHRTTFQKKTLIASFRKEATLKQVWPWTFWWRFKGEHGKRKEWNNILPKLLQILLQFHDVGVQINWPGHDLLNDISRNIQPNCKL